MSRGFTASTDHPESLRDRSTEQFGANGIPDLPRYATRTSSPAPEPREHGPPELYPRLLPLTTSRSSLLRNPTKSPPVRRQENPVGGVYQGQNRLTIETPGQHQRARRRRIRLTRHTIGLQS